MNRNPAADFPDTEREGEPMQAQGPVQATWLTRLLYGLALSGLVFSSLYQTSSYVGLVTGGGLIGWIGSSVFLLVSAVLLYRIYLVLRYRQALDARPSSVFGGPLRWLAWSLMLAGSIGTVSLFLIKPLTELMLKGGGEAGIGYFVVGMFSTALASVGWMGCLLFEASRPLGERVTVAAPKRSRSQRWQDAGVLGCLIVLAVTWPWIFRASLSVGCFGKTLALCVAKVEGNISRLAMASVGEPVMLQSNLDGIEYRFTGNPNGTLTERPAVSMMKSGHPVAPEGTAADVKVSLDASMSGAAVLVTLIVTEKGQQTASLTTRFKSGATLQPGAGDKRRLVVDVPRNVDRPFGDHEDFLDELHRQMRSAIGSQHEVAEASIQVSRPATLVATTPVPDGHSFKDARPAKSCDGIFKSTSGNPETSVHYFPGRFRAQLFFVQQPESPPVLLEQSDRVGCYDGAVWVATDRWFDRQLRLRKYDMTARLQRNLLLERRAKEGEFQTFDEASIVERDGQVEFDVVVQQITGKARRERLRVKL